MLSAKLVAFAVAASGALAVTPLVDKHYSYPDGLPQQVDTDTSGRGPQVGYNRCGPSTEGQSSLCQTSFLNALDDFCLWAPPNPNSSVGDVEGEMVAWCTKPGRGTRVMPEGTLQGVQFMKTPDYVQVVGFIDQTKINLAAGDFGGEMDPHGADLRGNPLGGLVYSNAFGSNKNSYKQVIEWHNFMGSNQFCFKVCDPAGKNAAHFCEHIYDRIGCAYNAPNNAKQGVFEACLGDNQDYPGIYTSNGVIQTYTQPAESLGAITTIPYQPKVPASSNCQPFASAQLYAAGASVTISLGPGATTTAVSSSTTSSATSPSVTATASPSTSTLIVPTTTPAPSTTAVIQTVTPTSSASTSTKSNDGVRSKAPAAGLLLSGLLGFLGLL